MKQYNTTQLNPDTCFERHVYHRDQFAHYLRWTHALSRLELGMNVLDFGCGSGNMAEVMYRNRYKGNCYLGLDIREKTVIANREKFKDVQWVFFNSADLCEVDMKIPLIGVSPTPAHWDLNVPQFLKNIAKVCSKATTLLISTPCYDEKTGAADNHIINGEVCEMTFDEFKSFLEVEFKIENKWGTFASQKDYKSYFNQYPGLDKIYEKLHEYNDSNIISNLMAPLFPEHSRNVLWECKLK